MSFTGEAEEWKAEVEDANGFSLSINATFKLLNIHPKQFFVADQHSPNL